MNTVKKIIIFVVAIFITVHAFTFNSFALAGAPVIAAEEITTVLQTALIGSGLYTESDLEGKSYLELNELLKDGINGGQIDPKKEMIYYRNPGEKLKFSIMEAMVDPKFQSEIGAKNASIAKISDNALSYWFNYMIENGGDLHDFIFPTYVEPDFDLNGYGAVYNQYDDGGKLSYRVYCEYIDIKTASYGSCYYLEHILRQEWYNNGKLSSFQEYSESSCISQSFDTRLYSTVNGDVRLEDGTQLETGAETIPVIGEVDGTQVTPDMLNPDGTVTIDGTTYYPKDFIDWDKFKDPAIIDLLNEILKAIENVPVIDNSQTDIGEIDADVTLPSELSDFSTPGLINVFTFCLPYDFIRGMRLFSAEPEIPHFETEIKIPAFLNVPAQTWKFEIDFKEFEPLAKITRWISLISFIYCLILLTPKIAKGA